MLTSVDWELVWQSLDWDDPAHQEEVIQQRLRQRARQLAEAIKRDDVAGATHTALLFDLGSEKYGVDVMLIEGVRTVTKITRVPGTPHFYRGVVNVRGQIISVLDLRLFFDMTVDDQHPPTELIIMKSNGLEIGLLAHHVEGVLTVARSSIEPLETMRYVMGVTMGRLVMLDIAQMFEDERLIVGGVEE